MRDVLTRHNIHIPGPDEGPAVMMDQEKPGESALVSHDPTEFISLRAKHLIWPARAPVRLGVTGHCPQVGPPRESADTIRVCQGAKRSQHAEPELGGPR